MSKWIVIYLLSVEAVAQTAGEVAADQAVGKKIFESQCALCHGQTGSGGRGPNLNRRQLNKAPDDETLRQVISRGIEPEMPGAWQLHPREVASVAAYVRSFGTIAPEKLPGDAARGARVYLSKGCAGCHIIAGKGEGFGPELSDIGVRRNGAYLRQTLLRPAVSLPEGFLYLVAVTPSGETVRGIRANEDSFSIQVKDAGGQFHSFTKRELKELRKLRNETPMPSYGESLSAAELDDLVAYLASLSGKS
jgi:cytochrome c oxidase cbb3-type subunit 3